MADRDDLAKHHELLGIDSDTPKHLGQLIFLANALQCHPDKAGPQETAERSDETKRFQRLCQAYTKVFGESATPSSCDKIFFGCISDLLISIDARDQSHSLDELSSGVDYLDPELLPLIVGNRKTMKKYVPIDLTKDKIIQLRELLTSAGPLLEASEESQDFDSDARKGSQAKKGPDKKAAVTLPTEVPVAKPKRKTKKQLQAEQYRREKEMKEIAARLEEKAKLDAEKEEQRRKAGAEKQRKRNEELAREQAENQKKESEAKARQQEEVRRKQEREREMQQEKGKTESDQKRTDPKYLKTGKTSSDQKNENAKRKKKAAKPHNADSGPSSSSEAPPTFKPSTRQTAPRRQQQQQQQQTNRIQYEIPPRFRQKHQSAPLPYQPQSQSQQTSTSDDRPRSKTKPNRLARRRGSGGGGGGRDPTHLQHNSNDVITAENDDDLTPISGSRADDEHTGHRRGSGGGTEGSDFGKETEVDTSNLVSRDGTTKNGNSEKEARGDRSQAKSRRKGGKEGKGNGKGENKERERVEKTLPVLREMEFDEKAATRVPRTNVNSLENALGTFLATNPELSPSKQGVAATALHTQEEKSAEQPEQEMPKEEDESTTKAPEKDTNISSTPDTKPEPQAQPSQPRPLPPLIQPDQAALLQQFILLQQLSMMNPLSNPFLALQQQLAELQRHQQQDPNKTTSAVPALTPFFTNPLHLNSLLGLMRFFPTNISPLATAMPQTFPAAAAAAAMMGQAAALTPGLNPTSLPPSATGQASETTLKQTQEEIQKTQGKTQAAAPSELGSTSTSLLSQAQALEALRQLQEAQGKAAIAGLPSGLNPAYAQALARALKDWQDQVQRAQASAPSSLPMHGEGFETVKQSQDEMQEAALPTGQVVLPSGLSSAAVQPASLPVHTQSIEATLKYLQGEIRKGANEALSQEQIALLSRLSQDSLSSGAEETQDKTVSSSLSTTTWNAGESCYVPAPIASGVSLKDDSRALPLLAVGTTSATSRLSSSSTDWPDQITPRSLISKTADSLKANNPWGQDTLTFPSFFDGGSQRVDGTGSGLEMPSGTSAVFDNNWLSADLLMSPDQTRSKKNLFTDTSLTDQEVAHIGPPAFEPGKPWPGMRTPTGTATINDFLGKAPGLPDAWLSESGTVNSAGVPHSAPRSGVSSSAGVGLERNSWNGGSPKSATEAATESSWVLLTNISPKASDDDLRPFCQSLGNVKTFERNFHNGTALIKFASPAEAQEVSARFHHLNVKGTFVESRVARDEDVPLFYEQFSLVSKDIPAVSATSSLPVGLPTFGRVDLPSQPEPSPLRSLDSVLDSLVSPPEPSTLGYGGLWPPQANADLDAWNREERRTDQGSGAAPSAAVSEETFGRS